MITKNNYRSFVFLTIHDEILIALAKGEQRLIPDLKKLLETTSSTIPMKVDVAATRTNWAEKTKLII